MKFEIMFVLYTIMESFSLHSLLHARNTDPLFLSSFDIKLWREPPLALITVGYLFFSKFALIGLLIYYGVETKWLNAIILGIVAIPASIAVSMLLEMILGNRLLTLITMPLLPFILYHTYTLI